MESVPLPSFSEETPEAKARWFQSLSVAERMDLLCMFTDLMLELNPSLLDQADDQSTDRHLLSPGTT
jgi:hypothetical protein